MRNTNLFKIGGTCALLVGISCLIVGLTYLFLPAEQKGGTLLHDPEKFLLSMAKNSTLITIHHLSFGLGALLGIGVVLALLELMRSFNEGMIRWMSYLGFLGFSVTAVDNFRIVTLEPIRAAAYVSGDAITQSAIKATGYFVSIDPHMWLGYGLVGLWIFTVSFVALRSHVLPKAFNLLGLVVGFLYFFVEFGTVLKSELLITLAAGFGAIIIGPLWYGRLSQILRKKEMAGKTF
jgi:Domain of unknown function (DUF4386)